MNPQNAKNSLTQRRASSTSYVTAWQIQSTLKNMLEFIDFIETFSTKRSHLKSVLSHTLRVKKINEEKESLVKQLKDLQKMNIPFQQAQKESNLVKNETKQKFIADNHEKQLQKMVNKLRQQTKTLEKQIFSLKQTTNETNETLKKIRNDKKQTLTAQINSCLSNHINSIADQIAEKQSSLNVGSEGSIYESFIEQHISKKLLPETKSSHFINSFSENSLIQACNFLEQQKMTVSENSLFNQNNGKNFGNDMNRMNIELGEIKCKLLSLQDKIRKVTVQNLLNRNKNSQKLIEGCNFDSNNNKKPIKMVQDQIKAKEQPQGHLHKQKEESFFNSLFSIFSGPSKQKTEIQPYLNFKEAKLQVPQTKTQRNPQDQIQKDLSQCVGQIEDNETKLRIIEINSDILQLRSHMEIMVNQNIFDQVIACAMKIQQINQQLSPLLDQLIEIIAIIENQSLLKLKQEDFSLQLTPFQSPKSVESRKLSLSMNSRHSVKSILKENENLMFFIGIIGQKFKLRVQVTQRLLESFEYSIKVAIKFLRKRLGRIKEQQESLVENGMKIDQKIKPTQTLKQRTQVLLLSSAVESLSCEINELIQNRLVKLREVLSTESKSFSKYLEDMKSQAKEQNDKDNDNNFLRAERQMLENIVLHQRNEEGANILSQINYDKQNDPKQRINIKLFDYYENLVAKILSTLLKQ